MRRMWLGREIVVAGLTALLHVNMAMLDLKALKLCQIKYELKIDYFYLSFLYKSDMCISTAGQHAGNIKIHHF